MRVHDSQAYTTRDVTRGRISRILSSDTTDATMIYLALYCIRSPQWSESVVDCREDRLDHFKLSQRRKVSLTVVINTHYGMMKALNKPTAMTK